MIHKKKIYKHYRKGKKGGQHYIINLSSIPLNRAKFISLYHGTSKEREEKIIKEGLQPRGGMISLTPSKSAAIIHALAPSERLSSEYAHVRVARGDINQNPSIIKVTIPKGDIESAVNSRAINLKTFNWENLADNPEEFKTSYEIILEKPVHQIKAIDFTKFKKRALSESRLPERVGKDYGTIQKSKGYKESRKRGDSFDDINDFETKRLFNLLPK